MGGLGGSEGRMGGVGGWGDWVGGGEEGEEQNRTKFRLQMNIYLFAEIFVFPFFFKVTLWLQLGHTNG